MKQTLQLKDTGSVFNFLMGNNSVPPVVGAGATILSYTDRKCAEVISISVDGKTVVLEDYDAIRTDSNGMSEDQDYDYRLNGNQSKLVWRNGAWRKECVSVEYTDEALAMTYNERKELLYNPESGRLDLLVEGLTKVKKSFPKVNILFGTKRAYYDFSF